MAIWVDYLSTESSCLVFVVIYLEKNGPAQAIPPVKALLLDGATIVDMVKPSLLSFHVQVNRAG